MRTERGVEGCVTETTGGAANSYRSLKQPGRLQRRKPKNEKHEMEVEIEKGVKAQKEAQSAAEVADKEEQISLNKESRAQVAAEEDSRRIAEPEGHQQRTLKRLSSLSESITNRSPRSDRQHQAKNDTNRAKQSGLSKNTQHNVKQLLCENNRNL